MDILKPNPSNGLQLRKLKIREKSPLKSLLTIFLILLIVVVGIDTYLIVKLPDSVYAPISLPSKIPPTFQLDSSSPTSLRWKVSDKLRQKTDITFTNRNDEKIYLKIIKPNDSISCHLDPEIAKKNDPNFISYKDISHPKVGRVCFEVFRKNDEIYQQYQWKESNGLYSLSFKKGLISENDVNTMLSTLNKVQMPIIDCTSKLNCLMYIMGFTPF